jgi:hypothetical protein
MVSRSPRRCKAFPPTATTNRCFFFLEGGALAAVVEVVVFEGSEAADVDDAEKNRHIGGADGDVRLIRKITCRWRNIVTEVVVLCVYESRVVCRLECPPIRGCIFFLLLVQEDVCPL